MIPNFWHPAERIAKPDISGLRRLRFLTTTDFPPFNYVDRNKRISGFNVDLARAICDELDILEKCQIQALPFDELEKALEAGDGEAVIAGLRADGERRARFRFSRPYFYIPGRFVARREQGFAEPMTTVAARHRTGLVKGSSHAEWFRTAFPNAQTVTFADRAAALGALREQQVDLVFSDALSLSFWLTSDASNDCCVFVGGPYLTPQSYADAMRIAFAGNGADLVAAVDYALRQINDNGTFAELYLRYFPLGLY